MNGSETGKGKIKGGRGKEKVGVGLKKKKLCKTFEDFPLISVSDPDPYQEKFIWIRVAPKINQNHGINKSKWFVNVLFT